MSITRIVLAVAVLTGLSGARIARAQPHAHSHDHDHAGHSHDHAGHDHAGHNHGGEVLAFRLLQGTTKHFDDPGLAAQHLDALQRIGCEVRQERHEAHTDVSYRCQEWKTMTLKTHELAGQWERWLRDSGFDVFHSHVAPSLQRGPETVEFRLVEWKSLHGDGPQAQLPRMIDMLKAAGCEVGEERHAGHSDVRYRAPIWTQIRLPNHAAAEQWMTFLRDHGFETRHQH